MNILCDEKGCKYCEYGECLLERAGSAGDRNKNCRCFYYVQRPDSHA